LNWFSRGIRNAFRNATRTFALVIILGLSIGLSLAMLIADHAVSQKINDVKGSVDNTISIFPAGIRGFAGGGTPLTENQLSKVEGLRDVTSVAETLSSRLTSSQTNLQSAVSAGSLGRRFAESSGFSGGFGGFSGGTFTPPVTVNGTNQPTNLAASYTTTGGGTFTLVSGSVFSSNSNADISLVGSSLASKNSLKVGSTFSAYSSTITVIGIFKSGNKFGNNQVIMPLTTLQRLSGETGDVTSATVYVNSVTNVNSVTSTIKTLLGSSADITNSIQQAQTTITTLQNIQTISLYSLIGAVIAGAVIILMTMVMIVRERRREIGVIKALGSSNMRIVGQFMAEAVTLTIVGAVLGVLIGVLAGNPLTQMLVSNSSNSSTTVTNAGSGFGGGGGFRSRLATGGGLKGINHGLSKIHAVVGYGIILDGLVAAIIIALIGSSVAAYFISKVRPAEVMRME